MGEPDPLEQEQDDVLTDLSTIQKQQPAKNSPKTVSASVAVGAGGGGNVPPLNSLTGTATVANSTLVVFGGGKPPSEMSMKPTDNISTFASSASSLLTPIASPPRVGYVPTGRKEYRPRSASNPTLPHPSVFHPAPTTTTSHTQHSIFPAPSHPRVQTTLSIPQTSSNPKRKRSSTLNSLPAPPKTLSPSLLPSGPKSAGPRLSSDDLPSATTSSGPGKGAPGLPRGRAEEKLVVGCTACQTPMGILYVFGVDGKLHLNSTILCGSCSLHHSPHTPPQRLPNSKFVLSFNVSDVSCFLCKTSQTGAVGTCHVEQSILEDSHNSNAESGGGGGGKRLRADPEGVLCTRCGAGNRVKSGKYRPKEMFRDGRKSCILAHTRLSNRTQEFGIFTVTPSTLLSAPIQFPNGQTASFSMEALLGMCQATFQEAILAQMMQSKVATMFVSGFEIGDVLRVVKAEKQKMETFFKDPPPVGAGRKYIAAAWTDLPVPDSSAATPTRTTVTSYLLAHFHAPQNLLEIVSSADTTFDTHISKSTFYELLRTLLHRLRTDFPTPSATSSSVDERKVETTVALPCALKEGLQASDSNLGLAFFMCPTFKQ
ncbi:hypothetical protein HDV05_005225, partial [Chytridiales sp. JEL 0842]